MLGVKLLKTMIHIILPQAFKNILPALGNEFVTLIKESSIISTIGVGEIMFNAQVVQGISFDPFTPLIIAKMYVLCINFFIIKINEFNRRRLKASD